MKALKGFGYLFIVVMLIGLSFLFTVREGQEAILLRLGKITVDAAGNPNIMKAGLHTKLPFITHVRKFDVRLQTLDIKSSRIVTAEKKDVIVDYYVKWRIGNVPVFYTRTGGDYGRAELLLEQQINGGLRAEFGQRTISEVISEDRSSIMDKLRETAAVSANKLGVHVVDVRIKRIDLPTEVSKAVFDRMRAERERVATEHRAEGKAKSEAIKGQADAKAIVIVADARAKANEIMGLGDAKATNIYASAYGQDPTFYGFYRSLQAYNHTFQDKNDILLLRPDSQFFTYFDNSRKLTTTGHAGPHKNH
ncbi:MAG: protease modulator HflC [Gammaproteobacteria bacterium]